MNDQNIQMLRAAVLALGELAEDLVFVGGCTTTLFVTDLAATEVRATKDVDAIVNATNYVEYLGFSDRLRSRGFEPDTRPDAPLRRWIKNDLLVDVMPLDEAILGFSNVWYRDAIRSAETRYLSADQAIRVVTPPYFLATKLEAFRSRGAADFLASHDLEDVLTVIDGRTEIVEEIKCASRDVRAFISQMIKGFLETPDFLDALPGHLLPDAANQARMPILLQRLRELAALS